MRRRHALVVGIDNYPGFGPEAQLIGGVRDARTMAGLLIERFGFAPRDVVVLLDSQATRSAILEAFESLRQRVKEADQVVLFFSGHGSQMTDRENDEGDGLDETLVPCDSGRLPAENRDITDDEINEWAALVLEVTPHMVLIFDCCHSATLHRPRWRVKSVPPDLRPAGALPPSPLKQWRDVETGPRPLKLAACRDEERAYELPPAVAGAYRGAFSWNLCEAMREATPGMTWREVFSRAATAMAVHCPDQHPEASGDGLDLAVLGDAPSFGRSRCGQESAARRLLSWAGGPDRFGLSMELFRSRGGAWRRIAEEPFRIGDRLRVDLSHGHGRHLFVYLLDIGLTGKVTLLFPDQEGHEALEPNTVLSIGARRGDAMEMFVPEAAFSNRSDGVGHLVLVAAAARLSTARLLSGSVGGQARIRDSVNAVVRLYRVSRS